ncbi:MAG: hypothetical protein HY758_02145 [Nitrospirae bacterium]|nr:hypothetical protein [Nitrospirota bacterium]
MHVTRQYGLLHSTDIGWGVKAYGALHCCVMPLFNSEVGGCRLTGHIPRRVVRYGEVHNAMILTVINMFMIMFITVIIFM